MSKQDAKNPLSLATSLIDKFTAQNKLPDQQEAKLFSDYATQIVTLDEKHNQTKKEFCTALVVAQKATQDARLRLYLKEFELLFKEAQLEVESEEVDESMSSFTL